MFVGFEALALLLVVVWVYALVDALRRPADAWTRAAQNQLVWVLVILLGNVLGAVIYFAVARPQLKRAG